MPSCPMRQARRGEAGSGVAFRSALWHRTERAGAGVWKLAVFYGYLL